VRFRAGNGISRAKVKISVVIPAFNEEKLITATLRSVQEAGAAFGALGWELQMVVCDNNSTDGTAGRARAAGARVVFEPVNQIARARNTGAAAADGEWLMFLDADSRPARELFA
jgi:glycosyltransferase involved in cell wall biosynthesis